jgi:ABC-type amino acid transport substrate-binding protein/ABC-type amino acid transport system permease subunit
LRLVILIVLATVCGQAAGLADSATTTNPSLAAAMRILERAKAAAATDCTQQADVLVRVLCAGRLRVGLRSYYPGFSVRDETGTFTGFEPDIARRIAAFLGVQPVLVAVDTTSRIPMVANGQVDLVIATMGHTVQRGAEVRFIRPHYYVSQTAIVGARDSPVHDWADLAGQTVCLPIGANSNLDFIRHHVRILTFDHPEHLLDALRFGECAFIVQDDTFFAASLADPDWSARYGIKFRFAPLPWGMAVASTNTVQFATLLDDLSIAFIADDVFLDLAKANKIDTSFLESQRQKWTSVACITAEGGPQTACFTPPVDNANLTDISAAAPYATWLEQQMASLFGLRIDLSLFTHQSTFDLLLEGVAFTLALIVGTQVSTLVFALGFGRLMTTGPLAIRRGVAALTAAGHVTPLPLLIFFAYVISGGIVRYSAAVGLVAAVVAIGFYNGSNAARAIDEANRTLQRRDAATSTRAADGRGAGFFRALALASVQLVAFLINAAKGSPAAGMIGVPDFLNVVTDLTASSPERFSMYVMLLVFYVGLVSLVILLLSLLRATLVPRAPGQN